MYVIELKSRLFQVSASMLQDKISHETEANKREREGKDDSRLTRNKLAETCGKTTTTGWRSATQHHSLDNWWLARVGATSS